MKGILQKVVAKIIDLQFGEIFVLSVHPILYNFSFGFTHLRFSTSLKFL